MNVLPGAMFEVVQVPSLKQRLFLIFGLYVFIHIERLQRGLHILLESVLELSFNLCSSQKCVHYTLPLNSLGEKNK